MGTASLRSGMKVELMGKSCIMLRKIDAEVWQLEEEGTKRVREYPEIQLQEFYAKGILRFKVLARGTAGLEAEGASQHKSLTAEEWEKVKMRRSYVMAVIACPNSETFMAPAILKVWQLLKEPAQPPHWTTVYRWKRRFIAAGRDATALALETNSGGNRRPRYPDEVTTILESAINTKYLTLERNTIQDALEHAQGLVKRENELRPRADQLPLPTRSLIKRMTAEIPAFDRHAARYGRTAAMHKFRSVQGHRTTSAPLERAEIDHTPVDLLVVDEKTGLPLGRPWLTCCIDDYSRCVLGIHVSFEPPSFLTAAHCLKHAFLPKVQLEKSFPSVQNQWAAHGVMRELAVDNGTEFHSKSLENACLSLGIEIHYAPRKVPWFKGKIERFLGTLNKGVAHGVPGTTFGNIFEKDDYDPSKHAVISLSRLQEIIHIWIVDYYHQKPHRTLQAPPAEVWKSSIAPEDILVPANPDELDAMLGRSVERTLDHRGILIEGLYYNSPELTTLRMHEGDRIKVNVLIDDSDIGHICVVDPDSSNLYRARALSYEYANGMSRWTHKVCKRFAAREMQGYDVSSWLEARLRISEIIEEEFMHKRKYKSRKRVARFRSGINGAAPASHQKRPNQYASSSHGEDIRAMNAVPATGPQRATFQSKPSGAPEQDRKVELTLIRRAKKFHPQYTGVRRESPRLNGDK